jgi:hypothetical protein
MSDAGGGATFEPYERLGCSSAGVERLLHLRHEMNNVDRYHIWMRIKRDVHKRNAAVGGGVNARSECTCTARADLER